MMTEKFDPSFFNYQVKFPSRPSSGRSTASPGRDSMSLSRYGSFDSQETTQFSPSTRSRIVHQCTNCGFSFRNEFVGTCMDFCSKGKVTYAHLFFISY